VHITQEEVRVLLLHLELLEYIILYYESLLDRSPLDKFCQFLLHRAQTLPRVFLELKQLHVLELHSLMELVL